MKAERNRIPVQGLFLLMLAVSAAQVLWWVFDQVRVSSSIEEQQLERWQTDQKAATGLLARGVSLDDLAADYPHLEIEDGAVGLRADRVEQLADDRRRHVRQYVFEGSFFLAVLFTAIAFLGRFLRQEAELRLRQENFLAAVSHELKSPLASLRLTNETLARRNLDVEKRANLVARNLDDVDRLDRLVGNLLDSSRLEAGKVSLEATRLDLHPLVAAAAADVFGQDIGTSVALDVPDETMIVGDPVATSTVVRNLLQNARDACRVAGVEAPVEVRSTVAAGSVQLTIVDHGVGFPPDEANKLFEKFYRPGNEMTRNKKGTGLGLYLVRRFMELAGGSVSASSEGPGKGATFVVEWPLVANKGQGGGS